MEGWDAGSINLVEIKDLTREKRIFTSTVIINKCDVKRHLKKSVAWVFLLTPFFFILTVSNDLIICNFNTFKNLNSFNAFFPLHVSYSSPFLAYFSNHCLSTHKIKITRYWIILIDLTVDFRMKEPEWIYFQVFLQHSIKHRVQSRCLSDSTVL